MRFDLRAGLNRLALQATETPVTAAPKKPKPDEPTTSGFNEKNKDLKESDLPGTNPEEKMTPGKDRKPNPLSTDKKAVVPKKGEEKKAEPKKEEGDGTLHCPKCGSAGPWTILDMNLRVHNVPASRLSVDSDDNDYDDTKGESEGWDPVQDGQIQCNKCKAEYDYNELVDMADPTPGPRVEGAKKTKVKAAEADLRQRAAGMTKEQRIERAVKTLLAPGGSVQQKMAFLKDRVGLSDDELQVALGTAEAGDMSAWEASLAAAWKPKMVVKAAEGEGEDSNRFVMVNIDVEVRPVTDEQVAAWEDLRPGDGLGEDLLMQLSQATGDQDNIHFVEAQVSDNDGNLE